MTQLFIYLSLNIHIISYYNFSKEGCLVPWAMKKKIIQILVSTQAIIKSRNLLMASIFSNFSLIFISNIKNIRLKSNCIMMTWPLQIQWLCILSPPQTRTMARQFQSCYLFILHHFGRLLFKRLKFIDLTVSSMQ